MGYNDTSCPVCSADIPLAGDEKAGEEVFCSSCGSPCRLAVADEESLYAEEDL